jgi:hypothetical protein
MILKTGCKMKQPSSVWGGGVVEGGMIKENDGGGEFNYDTF